MVTARLDYRFITLPPFFILARVSSDLLRYVVLLKRCPVSRYNMIESERGGRRETVISFILDLQYIYLAVLRRFPKVGAFSFRAVLISRQGQILEIPNAPHAACEIQP